MTHERNETPQPAVRVLVERWQREGMPPVRLLAGEGVHERGLRLSCHEWSAVVHMPFLCDTLGEDWPAWAADLCLHAVVVCRAVPLALLDLLLAAYRDRAGVACDHDTAALGVVLDLCVTSPHVGPGAWISITPFGHAVALLHLLHRVTRAAAAEHGDE
jgi:hypothetical protein